jgi:hypothetical protein
VKNLSQTKKSLGQDLNMKFPKYEAGALTTSMTHLVTEFNFANSDRSFTYENATLDTTIIAAIPALHMNKNNLHLTKLKHIYSEISMSKTAHMDTFNSPQKLKMYLTTQAFTIGSFQHCFGQRDNTTIQ